MCFSALFVLRRASMRVRAPRCASMRLLVLVSTVPCAFLCFVVAVVAESADSAGVPGYDGSAQACAPACLAGEGCLTSAHRVDYPFRLPRHKRFLSRSGASGRRLRHIRGRRAAQRFAPFAHDGHALPLGRLPWPLPSRACLPTCAVRELMASRFPPGCRHWPPAIC